jgi:hypothetical protein
MKPRYVVVKLLHREDAFCVDDSFSNKTKAVFYDEAAKELATDLCRQLNEAAGK